MVPRIRRALLVVIVAFLALPIGAQENRRSDPDRAQLLPSEFGQPGNDLWLPASVFTPTDSANAWLNYGYGYFASTTGGAWQTHIPLSTGNLLIGYRVYFSDLSPTGNIITVIIVYDYYSDTQTFGQTNLAPYTSSGTPGTRDVFVSTNLTIDQRPAANIDRFYVAYVNLPMDTNVRFRGIRLFWQRQVSPAPQTATFNDVPTTHPFHRFIEALYASGITGGCGNGNFCPDEPVTRGQMAVFLSGALGLHWAP
jgi:hypothetical protein